MKHTTLCHKIQILNGDSEVLSIKLSNNSSGFDICVHELMSQQPSFPYLVLEEESKTHLVFKSFNAIEQSKHRRCMEEWLEQQNMKAPQMVDSHDFVYELSQCHRSSAMRKFFSNEHSFKSLNKEHQVTSVSGKWEKSTVELLQQTFEQVYSAINMEKDMIDWYNYKRKFYYRKYENRKHFQSDVYMILIYLDEYDTTICLEEESYSNNSMYMKCTFINRSQGQQNWSLKMNNGNVVITRHMDPKEKEQQEWKQNFLQHCSSLLSEREDGFTASVHMHLSHYTGLRPMDEMKRIVRVLTLQEFELNLNRGDYKKKSKTNKLKTILGFFNTLQTIEHLNPFQSLSNINCKQ